jgi:hypothetical protein
LQCAALIIAVPHKKLQTEKVYSCTLGDQVGCGRFAQGAEVMPVVNRKRMLSRCPASQVGVARPALPRVFLAQEQMQWRYVQFANQPPKKLSPAFLTA